MRTLSRFSCAASAVSLIVYVFFIKNKADTYLDREQGFAFYGHA
ncbi:hypothetical protein ABLN85_20785 [Mycobacterium tuberculosis]